MREQVLDQLLERLSRLESEVQQIKELVKGEKERAEIPWWQEIAGSHKNDEAFAEIARLGAEIRRKECQSNQRQEGKPKHRKPQDRGKVGRGVRE
jgi:hypothetical protein